MAPASASSARRAAEGRAHGKLILVGEHSVVHGQPAIALPLAAVGMRARVSLVPGPFHVSCELGNWPLFDAPAPLGGLAACIRATLERLESPAEGLLLTLESSIPTGCGLGSSAAVAVAAVRALYAAHGREPGTEELQALVQVAETVAHGTPSGIDACAVAAEGPLWFVKGQPAEPLSVATQALLVVADTGRPGDTGAAVRSVHERLAQSPDATWRQIQRLGELAHSARTALANGEWVALGHMLDAAQGELAALGVSDGGLEALVAAARQAGALGAKLTGGGRGGCMLALARDSAQADAIAQALQQAGAAHVWVTPLGKEPA